MSTNLKKQSNGIISFTMTVHREDIFHAIPIELLTQDVEFISFLKSKAMIYTFDEGDRHILKVYSDVGLLAMFGRFYEDKLTSKEYQRLVQELYDKLDNLRDRTDERTPLVPFVVFDEE